MIDLERKKYSFRDFFELGLIDASIILHFERAKAFNEYRLQDFTYRECLEKVAQKFRCSTRTVSYSIAHAKSIAVNLS